MTKQKKPWFSGLTGFTQAIDKFKIKRADMALFLFFITICIYSVFNMRYLIGTADGISSVNVLVNGKRVSYDIAVDMTANLGSSGQKCIMRIENSAVWIERSDCPKQICVTTGKISSPGQAIICLHHEIVIEIKGEDDFDASIR